MTSHAAVMSHLAAASSASTNDITPGVLGFLVIAAMAVALFFLLRSMNKRLRRVRAVRDAGLAPGSELDTAANASANGAALAGAPAHAGATANASRGQAAGAAAPGAAAPNGATATGANSKNANSKNNAEGSPTADPADPANGTPGG